MGWKMFALAMCAFLLQATVVGVRKNSGLIRYVDRCFCYAPLCNDILNATDSVVMQHSQVLTIS